MKTIILSRWKAIGLDRDCDTCDCCGRTGLKKTVIMVVLDADGNREQEYRFGCQCAAKHTGLPVHKIRVAAEKADEQRAMDWIAAEGEKIAVVLRTMTPPEPQPLEKTTYGQYWGCQTARVQVLDASKEGFNAERRACYEGCWFGNEANNLAREVTIPNFVTFPESSVRYSIAKQACGKRK